MLSSTPTVTASNSTPPASGPARGGSEVRDLLTIMRSMQDEKLLTMMKNMQDDIKQLREERSTFAPSRPPSPQPPKRKPRYCRYCGGMHCDEKCQNCGRIGHPAQCCQSRGYSNSPPRGPRHNPTHELNGNNGATTANTTNTRYTPPPLATPTATATPTTSSSTTLTASTPNHRSNNGNGNGRQKKGKRGQQHDEAKTPVLMAGLGLAGHYPRYPPPPTPTPPASPSPLPSSTLPPQHPQSTCYFCGGMGHRATRCPHFKAICQRHRAGVPTSPTPPAPTHTSLSH